MFASHYSRFSLKNLYLWLLYMPLAACLVTIYHYEILVALDGSADYILYFRQQHRFISQMISKRS